MKNPQARTRSSATATAQDILEYGPNWSGPCWDRSGRRALGAIPDRKSARGLAHSKSWRLCPLGFCFFFSVLCSPVLAQSYSIDWWSVDGGGGTSTGGVYCVSGTIGQPDAGTMRGGNFTLAGGFWSIISVVQNPQMPLLSITNIAGTVKVFWPLPATGIVLDQATELRSDGLTPWSQVPFPYQTNSSEIYITIPPGSGCKFYQLRRP